jgi:glutamine amidotransferase
MIAIVDYEGGNLTSVLRALEYLGHKAVITADRDTIRSAERVIFPGVGSAQATMRNLRTSGLDAVLRDDVYARGIPFLGICIGVQIIFERSEEENTECLGLVSGSVARFPSEVDGERLKVPQIGWNQVRYRGEHPLFAGVPDGQSFYFVNSYHVVPANDDVIYAQTTYGADFPSVIGQKNLVATQFHLEKSGDAGLRMLDNFCQWNGEV